MKGTKLVKLTNLTTGSANKSGETDIPTTSSFAGFKFDDLAPKF